MPGEASWQARWAVASGASPTFDSSSVTWPFNSDTIEKNEPILAAPALRGTRGQIVSQTRRGPYGVSGTLTINPSPKFLGWAFPLAMGGGTETSPVFANALPEWGITCDRGTQTSTNYGECLKFLGLKIDRLSLRGSPGGLIECAIDVIGKTETDGITFAGAAQGTTVAYEPFQFADIDWDWPNSTGLSLLDWEFTLDNNLTARFNNSLTADEILEGNRTVTMRANVALLDADVYPDIMTTLAKNGDSGNIVITNSSVSTTLSFAAIQVARRSLQIQGQEIILPLNFECRGTTAQEFTVTNDVTP